MKIASGEIRVAISENMPNKTTAVVLSFNRLSVCGKALAWRTTNKDYLIETL